MKVYNQSEHTGRISLSKGNQIKINVGGFWYKADFLGYEGASEIIASDLLKQSNISEMFSFVDYSFDKIELNNKKYNGCKSEDFTKGKDIITLDEFLLQNTGKRAEAFLQGLTPKEQIKKTVEAVENITKLTDFHKYLTVLFELDAFIYNDDRHFNNIALLIDENEQYFYCPIFDNGGAFLSNLNEYPLYEGNADLRRKVQSKPFSVDFDKQKSICETLYGTYLKFDKDLHITPDIEYDIHKYYGDKILNRIQNCIDVSKNKYKFTLMNTFNKSIEKEQEKSEILDISDIER